MFYVEHGRYDVKKKVAGMIYYRGTISLLAVQILDFWHIVALAFDSMNDFV